MKILGLGIIDIDDTYQLNVKVVAVKGRYFIVKRLLKLGAAINSSRIEIDKEAYYASYYL